MPKKPIFSAPNKPTKPTFTIPTPTKPTFSIPNFIKNLAKKWKNENDMCVYKYETF